MDGMTIDTADHVLHRPNWAPRNYAGRYRRFLDAREYTRRMLAEGARFEQQAQAARGERV